MNLAVDVISDVICPWCYIGKRRLEKAIAAVDGQHDVQVQWHPFQLNPDDAERRHQPQRISHQKVRKLGAITGTGCQSHLLSVKSEGISFRFRQNGWHPFHDCRVTAPTSTREAGEDGLCRFVRHQHPAAASSWPDR